MALQMLCSNSGTKDTPVQQDCGIGWQEHRAAFQIVGISYRMLAL
jgi:hypothetical protein